VTIRDIKAHLVGGGIGSLAAAAFMIRDGGVPGKNITIYEALNVLGGSLDAAGSPEAGLRRALNPAATSSVAPRAFRSPCSHRSDYVRC